MWAAWMVHEGVVSLLLEREYVDPNTADTGIGGPLPHGPLSWDPQRGR